MSTKYYDDFSIKQKLEEIIFRTLNIQIDSLTQEDKSYPLLSRKFGVLPYQMLVLYTRIENEMQINLSEISVAEGKFNSYTDILSMVEEAIEHRNSKVR